MPDLIAQGPGADDRWRREVPDPTAKRDVVIGRGGADWNVPWDGQISRSHIRVRAMAGDRIEVRSIAGARNAVFHRGRQSDQFVLVAGDHFVIGRTTFTLVNRPGTSDIVTRSDVTEHAFDHVMLKRRTFHDAAARIEMLARLPDLITNSHSDQELLVRVTGVLLQATPSSSAVAIVALSSEAALPDVAPEKRKSQEAGEVKVLHYDSRSNQSDTTPVSARLVRSAIAKRESVLHLWTQHGGSSPAFTANEDVDWAFCVPLRSEACPGWALYVTGQMMASVVGATMAANESVPDHLQDDVKFAELVGTTIANLRQSRRMQRRQAELRHFFAPVVMEAMAGMNADEVLRPREANLSVMFCDLRGFSRASERDSHDLLSLLAQVSEALGVMTRQILATDGVIGDFHGDAAMGFWGWPLQQDDADMRAVKTAIAIRRMYADASVASGGFRCGIGIATGRAVAGRIGTVDQVKVTAFGPVVNLASRLEGITKAFGAEIIVDGATAAAIKKLGDDSIGMRRLGVVRPAGFTQAVSVFSLVEGTTTEEDIARYDSALVHLIDGRWSEAKQTLLMMSDDDGPRNFLLRFIDSNAQSPPDGWDGIIDMPK